MKNNISSFFDKFSKTYDFSAFEQSLGAEYLSEIETDFILKNFSIKKGDKILDIGVGTGRNASLLLDRGALVEGIDVSNGMMNEAKNKLKKRNINFTVADAGEKIPFKDHFFDYALCMRVLKYIPNWRRTIKEVSRVLKKEGIFILEISNFYSVAYFGLGNANYFLFKFKEVGMNLEHEGFKIMKIDVGSRLPFLLYKSVNNSFALYILICFERFLNKLLPHQVLSRNIFILCKKVK